MGPQSRIANQMKLDLLLHSHQCFRDGLRPLLLRIRQPLYQTGLPQIMEIDRNLTGRNQ